MICASLILGVHLASTHLNTDNTGLNNANVGVYGECDGWTAGVYRNSYRRTSLYAAHTWHWGPFALTAGAVTGYGGAWMKPLIAPSVTIGPFRVAGLPPALGEPGVFHLSIQHEFK